MMTDWFIELGARCNDPNALAPGHSVSNAAMRLAIELQCHAPITERAGLPPLCACGAENDVRGLHQLSCSAVGGRIAPHNNINNKLSSAYRTIGIQANAEYENQYPGRNTRPDNVLHSFGGKTVHVDVLVAQPVVHSAQLLLRHAARNGAAARRGEQRKRAKYAAAGIGNLPNTVLVPFVVEQGGRLGSQAKKHLSDMAAHAQRTGYCEPWFFFQSIAPGINAALIEGHLQQVRAARRNILTALRGGGGGGDGGEPWAGAAPHWWDWQAEIGGLGVEDEDEDEVVADEDVAPEDEEEGVGGEGAAPEGVAAAGAAAEEAPAAAEEPAAQEAADEVQQQHAPFAFGQQPDLGYQAWLQHGGGEGDDAEGVGPNGEDGADGVGDGDGVNPPALPGPDPDHLDQGEVNYGYPGEDDEEVEFDEEGGVQGDVW